MQVEAKKVVYNSEDAFAVVAEASKIVVASGKKIAEFDPKTADHAELLKTITGRTGNLRAPTLRVGDVFYVGFNVEMYSSLG